MLETMDPETARALLEWQLELGADTAVGESPVDRFAVEAAAPAAARVPVAAAAPADAADPVAEARRAARAAADLTALAEALAAYPHCELRQGARNTVFADGRPGARVMVIGEAPGRDEDQQGRPFVGRAGRLLDRMFSAIGLARDAVDAERALYITNILPWRPPNNREPTLTEAAMLMPFVERHVALADPDFLVLMGNTPLAALTGARGITRLRGQWREVLGRPALPMTHPAYLLRNPAAKREAWTDLLALEARLQA
jgi:DNA polymerase